MHPRSQSELQMGRAGPGEGQGLTVPLRASISQGVGTGSGGGTPSSPAWPGAASLFLLAAWVRSDTYGQREGVPEMTGGCRMQEGVGKEAWRPPGSPSSPEMEP